MISEAKAEHDAITEQWLKPLASRVARGWAIEGVSVVKYSNGLITLQCETHDSRFREGELIVLHRGNPQASHLDLEYDGETELVVSLINGNDLFDLKADPQRKRNRTENK